MKPLDMLTLGALSLVLAYGCTEATPTSDNQEDPLILRTGNVDHAAIVEVTTMMLADGPTSGVLDPYNEEDPFAIKGSSYAPVFAKRLASFDAYDGKKDWTAAQSKAWVSRVSTSNYLVVDTTKPCDFQ